MIELGVKPQMESSPYSITSNALQEPSNFSLSPLAKEFKPPRMEVDAVPKREREMHMIDADSKAFHEAVQKGDEERVVEILEEHSISTLTKQLKDNMGVSPLHVAAARGHHQLMTMLLMAGADPHDEELRSGVRAHA